MITFLVGIQTSLLSTFLFLFCCPFHVRASRASRVLRLPMRRLSSLVDKREILLHSNTLQWNLVAARRIGSSLLPGPAGDRVDVHMVSHRGIKGCLNTVLLCGC